LRNEFRLFTVKINVAMNKRKEKNARISPPIPNCARPIPKKKRTVISTPLIGVVAFPSQSTDSLGVKFRTIAAHLDLK